MGLINNKLLGRAQILQVSDIQYEVVEVPEWGGSVRVGCMNGEAREKYEDYSTKVSQGELDENTIRATLVAMSAVDDAGELIFTPEDIHTLGKKSYIALNRIFKVARRLNGLDETPEETEKN